jgi:hypothetical protein
MVVQEMTASEHAQRALDLLSEADADLAAGEYDSVSGKLWSAVEHAIAAIAVERGWECGDGDLLAVVQRLEEDTGDTKLVRGFDSASLFRDNSRYNFLDDYEFEFFCPSVHRFVPKMLAYLD